MVGPVASFICPTGGRANSPILKFNMYQRSLMHNCATLVISIESKNPF